MMNDTEMSKRVGLEPAGQAAVSDVRTTVKQQSVPAEVNTDPYKEGDPMGPTGRVTAIFDTLDNLRAVFKCLKTNLLAAGYAALRQTRLT